MTSISQRPRILTVGSSLVDIHEVRKWCITCRIGDDYAPKQGAVLNKPGFLVVIPARHVEENDAKPLRFSIVDEQERRNSAIPIRPAIHKALYPQQRKRSPRPRKHNVTREELVECRLPGNEADFLFSILCLEHLF